MKLRYTPAAICDLAEMEGYIRDTLQNPEAALRIITGIAADCARLKAHPSLGPELAQKLRRQVPGRYLSAENTSRYMKWTRLFPSSGFWTPERISCASFLAEASRVKSDTPGDSLNGSFQGCLSMDTSLCRGPEASRGSRPIHPDSLRYALPHSFPEYTGPCLGGVLSAPMARITVAAPVTASPPATRPPAGVPILPLVTRQPRQVASQARVVCAKGIGAVPMA